MEAVERLFKERAGCGACDAHVACRSGPEELVETRHDGDFVVFLEESGEIRDVRGGDGRNVDKDDETGLRLLNHVADEGRHGL